MCHQLANIVLALVPVSTFSYGVGSGIVGTIGTLSMSRRMTIDSPLWFTWTRYHKYATLFMGTNVGISTLGFYLVNRNNIEMGYLVGTPGMMAIGFCGGFILGTYGTIFTLRVLKKIIQ